jgi:fumarate reductase flavoprotein subunit
VNEQWNQHAFVLFDEPTLVESGQDTRFADPYHSGAALSSWDERMLREQTQKGRIKTADTLEKLAAKVGIDPEGLRETITRYNEDCRRGADSHFMKKTPKLCPVEQPPFYAVEIRAAIIGATGAGLDIDRECRVLDTKGRVIPGLFAAGEVLGVLNGKRYAGGGMSIGPAVILGRTAGRGAAAVATALRQTHA